MKSRVHFELPRRVAAEPAGLSRLAVPEPRMNVEPADGPRAAVQKLVGAAEGQIDLVFPEPVVHDPNRVRAVPHHDYALLPGCAGNAADIEELARPVDDGRKDSEADTVGHLRNQVSLVQ